VGIDDKIGINACKLLGLPFTTAIGLLVRSRQKGLIERDDASARLAALARRGRYRKSILDDAARLLEEIS
jgi:predicted nucleic acid-binding protein